MDGGEPRTGDTVALAAYLAERDAPCPHCGYNLRGVESSACPECGRTLQLGLVRRPRLLGWGPFLVLVFAWLLLAGGMNTGREVRRLMTERQQVVATNQRMKAIRASLRAQLQNLGSLQTSPFGGIPDDFPGAAEFRRFQQEADQQFNAMRQQMLKQQLAAMAPKSQPVPTLAQVWRSGTVAERANALWAAGLAVAALLGLLLTLIYRMRRPSPAAVKTLVAFAFVLFFIYAAWHIALFAREMV